MKIVLQDSSKNLLAHAYVWSNKDDPNLYGDWDFEVDFVYSLFVVWHFLYRVIRIISVCKDAFPFSLIFSLVFLPGKLLGMETATLEWFCQDDQGIHGRAWPARVEDESVHLWIFLSAGWWQQSFLISFYFSIFMVHLQPRHYHFSICDPIIWIMRL